jgi:hypothetical protein
MNMELLISSARLLLIIHWCQLSGMMAVAPYQYLTLSCQGVACFATAQDRQAEYQHEH